MELARTYRDTFSTPHVAAELSYGTSASSSLFGNRIRREVFNVFRLIVEMRFDSSYEQNPLRANIVGAFQGERSLRGFQ